MSETNKSGFHSVLAQWLRTYTSNGRTRAYAPELSIVLDGCGFKDALLLADFIEKVGEEQFVDFVIAFTEPGGKGRPKTNYSRWVDEFENLSQKMPGAGDYEIAAAVAREAFQYADWKDFKPPSTEKSMANTLRKHVIARRNEDAKPSAAKISADRVRARVSALCAWAAKWQELSSSLGEAQN